MLPWTSRYDPTAQTSSAAGIVTALKVLDTPPFSGTSIFQVLPSQCSLSGHVACCASMKLPTAQTSLRAIAATPVNVLDMPPSSATVGVHLLPFQCSLRG